MASDGGVVTPRLMLETQRTMSLEDEKRVIAALATLTEPLEKDQDVELAGIKFHVVHP